MIDEKTKVKLLSIKAMSQTLVAEVDDLLGGIVITKKPQRKKGLSAAKASKILYQRKLRRSA